MQRKKSKTKYIKRFTAVTSGGGGTIKDIYITHFCNYYFIIRKKYL